MRYDPALTFTLQLHHIHIRVIIAILAQHAMHLDLLDQAFIIGIDRSQPIQQIIDIFVRGAIAQSTQRPEAGDSFPANISLHVLRLIDDDNRIRRADKIKRPTVVALLVHDICRLGKTVDIYHHDLQRIVGRKLTRLASLFAIPHIKIHFWIVVFGSKMLTRDFQIFHHTLANRHTRHHDDKLLPAIFLMELVNRTQVNIGLAGTGFHFDGEVEIVAFCIDYAVLFLHRSSVFHDLLFS